MSTWIRAACALFALSAIAAPPLENHERLIGEWVFVQGDMRFAMSPPVFDVVEFSEGGALRLTSSVLEHTVNGRFTVGPASITWIVTPVGGSEVTDRLKYSWRSDGALILRWDAAGYDWVFLRPSQILSNVSVAGTWLLLDDRVEEYRLVFHSDGRVRAQNDDYMGVYRLWQGRSGLMMTQLIEAEGHSLMLITRVKLDRDKMTLVYDVAAEPRSIPSVSYRRVADDPTKR